MAVDKKSDDFITYQYPLRVGDVVQAVQGNKCLITEEFEDNGHGWNDGVSLQLFSCDKVCWNSMGRRMYLSTDGWQHDLTGQYDVIKIVGRIFHGEGK